MRTHPRRPHAATASDSVFDPFANIALYVRLFCAHSWQQLTRGLVISAALHRKAAKADPLKYPSGGSRLTTIGNILYAFLMGSVSLILIVESIRALATHGGGETTEFHM